MTNNSIPKSNQEMQEKQAWENLEVEKGDGKTRLEDRTRSGRAAPWKKHANNKEGVAELFDLLGLHYRADKIIECASRLWFLQCSIKPHEHRKTLAKAKFCKDKFCPMCNWRRSARYTAQMLQLLTELEKRMKVKFIFLTLTVRNVKVEEDYSQDKSNDLRRVADEMSRAWNKFTQDKLWKKIAVGWIRTLEITVNNDIRDKEWYNTYHPHFHVLIAVKPEYFTKELYSKNSDWASIWKRCMELEYDPIVDVRKVKKYKPEQLTEMEELVFSADGFETVSGALGAVLEVAKYPLKMTDIFTDATYQKLKNGRKLRVAKWAVDKLVAKKRLWDLHVATNRKKMITFGGLFKTIREELKQQDLEDEKADLLHTNQHDGDICKCPDCGAIRRIWKYLYNYKLRDYIHEREDS